MTVRDTVEGLFATAEAWAWVILAGALVVPVLGTGAAWIGRGGRTDADGKFIASALMGTAMVFFLVEVVALWVGSAFLGRSPWETHVALAVAPPAALGLSFLGVRRVFPLSQLSSVQTARDLALFVAALGVGLGFLTTFRGWSILVVGSVFQLLLVLALWSFVVWRLWVRVSAAAAARGA